jgi:hypothetical protein
MPPQFNGQKQTAMEAFQLNLEQSSASQNTFAPPLRNRDLRGCPDDEIIQDPMSNLSMSNLPMTPIGMSRPAESKMELPSKYPTANDCHSSPL